MVQQRAQLIDCIGGFAIVRAKFPLTDVERTYRQLALVWGVIPELVPRAANYEEMFEHARLVIERRGLAQRGDRVLVTAGVPFDVPGTTNLLRVEVV